jgi:hypothetical protein
VRSLSFGLHIAFALSVSACRHCWLRRFLEPRLETGHGAPPASQKLGYGNEIERIGYNLRSWLAHLACVHQMCACIIRTSTLVATSDLLVLGSCFFPLSVSIKDYCISLHCIRERSNRPLECDGFNVHCTLGRAETTRHQNGKGDHEQDNENEITNTLGTFAGHSVVFDMIGWCIMHASQYAKSEDVHPT